MDPSLSDAWIAWMGTLLPVVVEVSFVFAGPVFIHLVELLSDHLLRQVFQIFLSIPFRIGIGILRIDVCPCQSQVISTRSGLSSMMALASSMAVAADLDFGDKVRSRTVKLKGRDASGRPTSLATWHA